jgi:hypothetical protein
MDNAGVSISKCDAPRRSNAARNKNGAPTSKRPAMSGSKSSGRKSQKPWAKPKRKQALWVGIFKVQDKTGRKKVKRISARKRESIEYSTNVVQWKKGRRCSRCGKKRRIECHHSRGRAGSLLLDQRFWIPLCFHCHRWVHQNPEEARSQGFLCLQGDWNRPKVQTARERLREQVGGDLAEVQIEEADDGGED